MASPKTLFIVNPAAGAGRAGPMWGKRRALLHETLGGFEEALTERPGHAAELARASIEAGTRRIIAFGGDGTWHELVEGFMTAPEAARRGAALGCFPAGSGCDFARHMSYPSEPAALAEMISRGRTRMIDAVRAEITMEDGSPNVTHLTNMAAFGLGGDVALGIERAGKRAGGTLSYLLVTLALILRSRPREFEMTLDGEAVPERMLHTAILANTSTTGGGMRVAPEADAEDGAFELVTVGEMSRLDMIRKLHRLYKGTHIGERGIGLFKGALLKVRAADGKPAPLNIDGEALGGLPAEFRVLPKALPVLAPS